MKWNKSLSLLIVVCLSQFVYGQDNSKKSDKLITISGKVLNTGKEPVAGAVLYIDNVKTNNVTKNNGSYKIKVSPSAIDLEVRSPGYENSIAEIKGQTTINFVLAGTNFQVQKPDDVKKAARLQDTVKKSSGARGKKMNTYNDIYQMIRAEVSGVVVSGRSIQIEQGHSFFGSSTPLFVINGVIVQSIDNVNPRDVKSIRVLKGSEASIYGVNGTNGVISITLKNGTEKEN
jgi:TonB-dependent SusC/RagA subfamily outer membrane receptor